MLVCSVSTCFLFCTAPPIPVHLFTCRLASCRRLNRCGYATLKNLRNVSASSTSQARRAAQHAPSRQRLPSNLEGRPRCNRERHALHAALHCQPTLQPRSLPRPLLLAHCCHAPRCHGAGGGSRCDYSQPPQAPAAAGGRSVDVCPAHCAAARGAAVPLAFCQAALVDACHGARAAARLDEAAAGLPWRSRLEAYAAHRLVAWVGRAGWRRRRCWAEAAAQAAAALCWLFGQRCCAARQQPVLTLLRPSHGGVLVEFSRALLLVAGWASWFSCSGSAGEHGAEDSVLRRSREVWVAPQCRRTAGAAAAGGWFCFCGFSFRITLLTLRLSGSDRGGKNDNNVYERLGNGWVQVIREQGCRRARDENRAEAGVLTVVGRAIQGAAVKKDWKKVGKTWKWAVEW